MSGSAPWPPEDRLPRLGWVGAGSRVDTLPEAAETLGLAWFGLKRDDAIPGLHGGTKVRKLDVLLAQPPWRDAPCWEGVGAVGSGQLTALTEAATALDRRVRAHTFWEPLSDGVLDNLARIAIGPVDFVLHRNRVSLGLTAPHAVLGWHRGGRATVPAGASCAGGTVGVVLGMFELQGQIEAGALPAPETIVLPVGSGGTVAGLLLGSALCGLPARIVAVSTVERWMGGVGRIRSLVQEAAKFLRGLGLEVPKEDPTNRLRIEWGEVGPGYGIATARSVEAASWITERGAWAEPIYGGKAMAWLLRAGERLRGQRVLFWHTPRRALPPPPEGWEQRLPPRLLAMVEDARARRTGVSRRRLGWLLVLPALALPWARPTEPVAGWEGEVLSAGEARVLIAAAAALLPDEPGGTLQEGASFLDIARRVDRYLVGLPARARLEIHALLALVERGTGLAPYVQPLTRLTATEARDALLTLRDRHGQLRVAVRGLRDLLLLARWQDARLWPSITYPGPWVAPALPTDPHRPDGLPARPSPYDSLVAPPGALPAFARR